MAKSPFAQFAYSPFSPGSSGSTVAGRISKLSSEEREERRKKYAEQQASEKAKAPAKVKFDNGNTLTLKQDEVFSQWDKLNKNTRNRFIKQLEKNGDEDSAKVREWLATSGRLKGDANDWFAGAADKLAGGVGRGILRGADQLLPGRNTFGMEGMADEWDRRVKAQDSTYADKYRQGQTAGTVAKGALDVASIVAPSGVVDKAVKGTRAIKALGQMGKAGQAGAFVARTLPGSVAASGADYMQQIGRGDDANLAQTAAVGLGVDLAMGTTGRALRTGRQALRERGVQKVVGKEANNLLKKVGSATNLADLYDTAVAARKSGERALTRDEQNIISLVKNQKINFGGDVKDAFGALESGDVDTLRHAFDSRSKADRFVSGLVERIAGGTYDKLKYSKVGEQLRRALGDKLNPVYDAIDRSDASFQEKQMLKDLVDFGSGSVRRGSASNELLDIPEAQSLTSDLYEKAFVGGRKGAHARTRYDDVSEYIAARHENTLMDNGIKDANDALRKKNDAVIARYAPEQTQYLEGKYEQLKAVNQRWLDRMRDEGLITPEKHQELASNPDYIRVQRELAEDAPEAMARGGGSLSMTDPQLIQKTGKSQSDMIDPLATFFERSREIGQRLDKNRASKAILPGLEDMGIGQKLPDTATVSDEATYTQNVAGYMDEGMPKRWELPTDVAESIKNQHVESLGKVMQIFGAPTRLFKTLTTGINPAFGGPNLARDIQGAAKYADGGAKFYRGLGESLSDTLAEAFGGKTSKEFQEYMLSERAGTFLNLQNVGDVRQARKAINREARQKSDNRVRVIASKFLGSPTRGLETVANLSEQYTRYASYKTAKDLYLQQGMSDKAAHRQAILAARNNSVDFFKGGTTSSALNTFIPYLNPAIQGARKFAKTMRERPIEFLGKITSQLAVPATIATMWNLHDEETRQIYMDIPESEKEANFLFIIPGMSTDGRNRYNVVKIPMPPGFSNFVQPIRRTLEGAAGMKPAEFGEIAKDILSPFTGVQLDLQKSLSQTLLGNPVAKGAVQYMTNRDLYFDRDIVPGNLQGAPAQEQFNENTSGTAVRLGEALGLSPMKLQQLGRDMLGGGAPLLFNAADQVQEKVLGMETQQGGKSVGQSVADRFTSATGGEVERQFWNSYGDVRDLHEYRESQINKLLKSGDSAKIKQAQRIADEYNREVDNKFGEYFNEYGAYLPDTLSNGSNPMEVIDGMKIDIQVSKKGKPYMKW